MPTESDQPWSSSTTAATEKTGADLWVDSDAATDYYRSIWGRRNSAREDVANLEALSLEAEVARIKAYNAIVSEIARQSEATVLHMRNKLPEQRWRKLPQDAEVIDHVISILRQHFGDPII